jgi:hypothetical protein
MRNIRLEGQTTAKTLWTSAAPQQLAQIIHRVRALDAAAATEWLDGFFQELRSLGGPQVKLQRGAA